MEEESLTKWAIGLITGVKPFTDACGMELVLTVLTLHRRQRFIALVLHGVTNVTLFNTSHFFLNVVSPQENGRNDITISCLE